MEEWPTFDLRAKWEIPKEWEIVNYQPLILGERFDADYFVPDSLASDTRDVVYSLGWKYAANLDKKEEIACMYASAMSAFAPELEDEFLSSMKGINIHPHRIYIPIQANASRIVLNELEKYGPDEKLVLFGTGLYILYKKIHMMKEVNYNRLVTNSINVLGGKLGMSHEVLSRLRFPLTHEKACAVIGVFHCFELKAKIIRYLMLACKQKDNLSIVSSYMCEILAWSEMTIFFTIIEMLHATKSPVLQDMFIQHEVRAFYYIKKKIDKSEYPQFFRYFCSGLDDVYLEREYFPILALVAETVRSDELRAFSSEQVVAKPKVSSANMDRLVGLHRSYVALSKMKSTA